jgi:hypothetical protein
MMAVSTRMLGHLERRVRPGGRHGHFALTPLCLVPLSFGSDSALLTRIAFADPI